jgi:hypothetical protein
MQDTNFLLQTWSFNPQENDEIEFAMTEQLSHSQAKTERERLQKMPVYFNSLSGTGITYDTLPAKLSVALQKVKGVSTDTRFHKYNGKYYFTDTFHSGDLGIYDPRTDSLSALKYDHRFLEIKDFVLYDITGDNQPEVIIFSVGNVPRDNAISIDIYMLKEV